MAVTTIIDLPGYSGALIPVTVAATRGDAVRLFRAHAVDDWGWPTPGNYQIEGPHPYVNRDAYNADPSDYTTMAADAVRGMTYLTSEARDEAVRDVADQLAVAASQPGGWQRAYVLGPDDEAVRFWKITTGIAGG